jgi:hypothetical protein
MARDYAKEYREYHSKPEQKKKRAQRNKARRMLEREGKVSKGDGKDVAHKKSLKSGGTSSRKNLKVSSQKANRGWRKGKSGYSN